MMDDEPMREAIIEKIGWLDHSQLTALSLFMQRFPRPLTENEELALA